MKGFPYNIGCKPKVGLRAPLTMTFTIHIHYLLIFRMRRFTISILSLITLLLSACTQKDDQGLDKQNKVQYLRISAEVKAQDTRSIDYKLVNNRVRYSLGNKTQIPVYTCIYEGSRLLFNERLNWTVKDDKKTLSFDGDINFTASVTNPNSLRILAVIGDATGTPTDLTLAPAYSEGQVIPLLSTTTPTTINVPYIMEAKLARDLGGHWIPQGENKTFKPYGHLLRVRMINKTGAPVTVTGVSSNRVLADGIQFHPRLRELKRKEYNTPLNLKLSREVTIANDQTAGETFLLWVPRLDESGTYHRLDLTLKDVESSRLYTTMRIPKGTVDYMDGVIYKAEVTLYKTAIPNPLSLLSEDVINKEGTDFVNLRNTFQIDNLATYNGAGKVGYFKHADAINRFCVEDTYPSTGGINWHLPDFFEWNTILYDPRNTAGTGYTDREERVRVKVGVGSQASQRGPYSYWKTISYKVHIPNDAKGTYVQKPGDPARPTIKTGKSFYVLSFAEASAQLPDDKTPHRFPREETNINRYAFRYTLHEDRFVITCVPIGIQNIAVTDLPNLPALFSSKAAVSRIIPFYGISNQAPFTYKDNTAGNRRIIDYVTNTRDETGQRTIAAFSAPTNKVLPYPLDIAFPVALFKKVTE